MFYFKVTVRTKRGDTKTSRNFFRECLAPSDVGEMVATRFAEGRHVTSIAVTRISQAAYIRATRSD